MYKVKEEDIIPTRTSEEIRLLEEKNISLAGATKKSEGKVNKLHAQFSAMAKNMTRDKVIPFVEMAHKMSDLLNTRSTQNAVCAKGCSYCCQVNIDVTAFEAAYIEDKTGREAVEKPYNLNPLSKDITFCPFHDEDTALCTIHEFRPMACRGFFAFDDPKLCVGNDKTHSIMTAFHNPPTKSIYDVMKECGGGVVKDIRAYFE